jgi:predicted nicotinamide N-methyase
VPDGPQQRAEQLRRFVLEHTALRHPPEVPEVRLHLTDDLTALWIRAEAELGRALEPPFWASAWAGGLAVARFLLDHPEAANGVLVHRVQRDLLAEEPPAVDVVIAGDVCYERTMSERAVGWLRAARRDGADVLLGDPGRAYLPGAGLARLARYAIAPDADLESPRTRETSVYALDGAECSGRSFG